MFSFIYAWTNGYANNRDAGDLIRRLANYDLTVMFPVNVRGTLQVSRAPSDTIESHGVGIEECFFVNVKFYNWFV